MMQNIIKQESFMDKASWGSGPWDNEPDKAEWIDKKTGLPCLIVRNNVGSLCGYVGVDKDHYLYGIYYNYCAAKICEADLYCKHSPQHLLAVHGGITYSDLCQEDRDHGICHTIDDRKIWWFGFDTSHAGDLSPSYKFRSYNDYYDTYKDIEYVMNECERLAKQISGVCA